MSANSQTPPPDRVSTSSDHASLFSRVVLSVVFVLMIGQTWLLSKSTEKPPPADAGHRSVKIPDNHSRRKPPPVVQRTLKTNRKLALKEVTGTQKTLAQIKKVQAQVRLKPKNTLVWVKLGRLWFRHASLTHQPRFFRHAHAAAVYAQRLSPGSSRAGTLRAQTALELQDFTTALQQAQRVVTNNPSSPLAWGIVSDAYREAGQYPDAWKAALSMKTLRVDAHSLYKVAYLRWLRGETKQMYTMLQECVQKTQSGLQPEKAAQLLVMVGDLYRYRGHTGVAKRLYRKALQLVPNAPNALVSLARLALKQKQWTHATSLVELAANQSRRFGILWLQGVIRSLQGDDKGADEAFARALRTGRKTAPLQLSLALSTSNRQPRLALRLAMQEARKRPGNVFVQDALAWALYRNGQFYKARLAIDKALRLKTPFSRFLYHAGAIYLQAGSRNKGVSFLKKALTQHPQFDVYGAPHAKQLLKKYSDR